MPIEKSEKNNASEAVGAATEAQFSGQKCPLLEFHFVTSEEKNQRFCWIFSTESSPFHRKLWWKITEVIIMAKVNSERRGCVDVFHSFLVHNAKYEGVPEMPVIFPTMEVPNRLIPFSKAVPVKDYDQWVHFYEDDAKFERIWKNPKKYLPLLSKFNGVISPDFSLWVDMPQPQQIWNTYRNRALACWLQSQGVKVISNIRFSTPWSYSFCFNGAPKKSVVSVGTHGLMKGKRDRERFKQGLQAMVDAIEPIGIVVYGTDPDDVFQIYRTQGIRIFPFPSDCSKSHKGGER